MRALDTTLKLNASLLSDFLESREVGHLQLDELIVTDSMHARKQRMFDLSDAFVVLPGGIGTLDETMEIITWKQLGLHDKPIILADVAGYWRPLCALFDAITKREFMGPEVADLYTVVESVDDILAAIARAPAPAKASSDRL